MSYYNGIKKEGLWENGNFKPGEKSDIRIGKKIDFQKYTLRSDVNQAEKEAKEIEDAKKVKDKGGRID